MNGAVSNLAVSASSMGVLGHELRNGGYDVVHVHEPNVPAVSWFAVEASPVPVVGTFHTYSTSRVVNGIAANLVGARRLYGKLSARIAVSEAAAWTARRYYGGRYRIVPNGVDLAAARPRALARRRSRDPLHRPSRGPQGPADPAARLRGAARRRHRRPAHDRRRPGRGGRAAAARSRRACAWSGA